jgi:hypothetical protein
MKQEQTHAVLRMESRPVPIHIKSSTLGFVGKMLNPSSIECKLAITSHGLIYNAVDVFVSGNVIISRAIVPDQTRAVCVGSSRQVVYIAGLLRALEGD